MFHVLKETMTEWQDYLELCHKSMTSRKRARPKYKPDGVIQLNYGGVRTYASCETTSNIGELRPPRRVALKMLLLSDELWLTISVALHVHGVKTYGNRKH